MRKRYCKYFLLAGIIILSLTSCGQEEHPVSTIKGVYGDPTPLWEKGLLLKDLGINSIFVRSGSIDQELMDRARAEGLQVYAEFATLNGKNYVEDHPEAWAINEKGDKVEQAGWFMGVCPTDPGFQKYRFEQLKDLLSKYELDGIWLDYVHWHAQFEDPEPILPETCFCDHCLSEFSEVSGLTLPEGSIPDKSRWIFENHDDQWRDWRCKVIYDMTIAMKKIMLEIRPNGLLGLYHSPWDDKEFEGAMRRILGLDLEMLKGSVDVFSPMVYHARMGREPIWVQQYVDWMSDKLDIDRESQQMIWPIVQAHDDPYPISGEEFGKVLGYGLTGASKGVMMFTASSVAADNEKLDVMKRIYLSLE